MKFFLPHVLILNQHYCNNHKKRNRGDDDGVNEIKIKVTCGAEIDHFLTNFGQILQAAERMEK